MLCLERFILATETSCVCSVFGESCTCTLLKWQDVANQRQSRAGHAGQGSVIENNTATAGNHI